jgi:aspartyl-tRNA(Asn)/glutamyl-tRNA(Gln) amidotransferase subunit C
VDSESIKKTAQLAKLALTDKELSEVTEQLTLILKHFEKISEIPTENIEPLLTPTEIEIFLREDVVQQELSSDEILQNAPSSQGHLFKVPPVVG